MSICESCWLDAQARHIIDHTKSVTEHYQDLISERLAARVNELEESLRQIKITEDSYNTEQEVLGEIYLIAEQALKAENERLKEELIQGEDNFINRLLHAISMQGHQCCDWDGDCSPEQIIANGITTLVEESREKAEARVKEMSDVITPHIADLERMKEVFAKHGKGCFASTITEIDKAIGEFKQALKENE